MKHFVILQIFILVLLNACNTSDDYFKKLNHKPEITVKGEWDSDFFRKESDSVKVRNSYNLYYKIYDEEGEKLTAYIFCDPFLTYTKDNEKIIITATREGKGKFKIYTTDSFGATDELIIQFTCFNNLPPVAILEIEDIPGFPKNEKRLNASQSYDQDNKYGGEIALYRFYIKNIAQNSEKEFEKAYHAYMDYTFPTSGEYEIGLRIKDNDGQWSVKENKTVIIN